MSFPLHGVKVLELAGLAPGPFTGMVLADFGADVVRVDKLNTSFNPDVLTRGKRSIALSLKSTSGVELIKTLLSPDLPVPKCSKAGCKCSPVRRSNCASNAGSGGGGGGGGGGEGNWRADILIDPFRPGVLERLGLSPTDLLILNPRLIIARLTGFRRDGPYSTMAGHDINYAALSGVLSMLGRAGEKPMFPANILADFGGGGMMAVLGILMALFEREKSGLGQVIEIDMVTGTRYLSSFPLIMARPSLGLPIWDRGRGENVLDGGAPWYEVYETACGGYMTVGAIEPAFYAVFLKTLMGNVDEGMWPVPPPSVKAQQDRTTWSTLATFFTRSFLTKSRDEWTTIFLGTDACVAPILERHEVDAGGVGIHEKGLFTLEEGEEEDGGIPCPAPRLGRTPAKGRQGGEFFLEPGRDSRSVLVQAGLGDRVDKLVREGTVQVAEEEGGRSKL